MITNDKRYLGLIPGVIALIVYSMTACRSIWIGDSGEFALALDTLGICHPPGYPLFTLLGRLFIVALPFMRPILAGGVFNIVVAAAAVAVIYYIFNRSHGRQAAMTFSLIFAFSPIFWAETVGVEIYTLNVLLIALTFLVLESRQSWKWPLAFYLFGLSLTNHPSALSLAPALIYLFVRERGYRNWKLLPILALLVGIAGSVYLYMLVRSSCDPISDWGNPETFDRLIDHMTLKQYSGWVHNSFEGFMTSVHLFLVTLWKSWWWIGFVGIVAGIIAGWKIARARTISATLILVSSLLLASSHQAVNYEPFYLAPMFASLLLIANNFQWIVKRFDTAIVKWSALGVTSICLISLLAVNYHDIDRSDYTLAEDYGKHLLDTADRGILFTAGDINSFPAIYLRYVEDYKTEVELFDRSIRKSALIDMAAQIAGGTFDDYKSARDAVIPTSGANCFLSKSHYVMEPGWLDLSGELFSFGMLYAVNNRSSTHPEIPIYPIDFDPGDPLSRYLLVNLDLARGEEAGLSSPPDSAAILSAYRMAIRRMDSEPRALLLNEIGIYLRGVGMLDLALDAYKMSLEKPLITPETRRNIRFNISNVFKDKGNEYHRAGNSAEAVLAYIKALEYDPENPLLHKNIGLIYLQEQNDYTKALTYLKKYVGLSPWDTDILEIVRRLEESH